VFPLVLSFISRGNKASFKKGKIMENTHLTLFINSFREEMKAKAADFFINKAGTEVDEYEDILEAFNDEFDNMFGDFVATPLNHKWEEEATRKAPKCTVLEDYLFSVRL